jgi:hypothetical protein
MSPHAYQIDFSAFMRIYNISHVFLLKPVATDPLPE